MKIVAASADQLLITDRPWLLAGFIWAMGLAALYGAITGNIEASSSPDWVVRLLVGGLGIGATVMAWIAFPFQRLQFDRSRGEFRRDVQRVLSTNVEVIPLAGISRAKLERSWGESTWMDRVALDLDGRSYPLEWGFVGTSRQPVVDAINQWLETKPDE